MWANSGRRRRSDETGAVVRRTRRLDGVVMGSHHVDLGNGQLLWLHPSVAQPGDRVSILRCGEELMVWSADPEPRLLVAHLPPTATRPARSFARRNDESSS